MAVTIQTVTLVNVTPNELVYLVTAAEGAAPPNAGIITTTGAVGGVASPDLAVDCVKNTWGRAACKRLRQVCRAGIDGLGLQAANGWSAAEALDLLMGDGATQAGSQLMPRAEVDLQPVNGVAGGALIEIEAGQAAGAPILTITAAAVAGQCILRIRLRSTPGVK